MPDPTQPAGPTDGAQERGRAGETVVVTRRGAQLRIELNRPDSMNAFDRALGVELRAAVELAAGDETVRSVVITGRGRAFSSGADLRTGFEPNRSGRPDVRAALRDRYHPIIVQIRRMDKPVIAAVNGPAVGIGLSLALACDLIVARRSAYFMLAFVNIGLAPDGGSSLLLPARVGASRAAEMAMLGERVPASVALEWGLVNHVVDDEAFEEEIDALAARLASGPTRSYAAIKQQLNATAYVGLEEHLELEAALQAEMAGSEDFEEGVGAFLAKRAPRFSGR